MKKRTATARLIREDVSEFVGASSEEEEGGLQRKARIGARHAAAFGGQHRIGERRVSEARHWTPGREKFGTTMIP